MKRLLGNDNVLLRFIGLYSIGLVIFFASWIISYYFLPEGILRNISILGRLAGETAAETAGQEFRQIFGLNLIG
ncbi:hypothetical protein GF326_12805 [Candidatus Bathyarchaeota archaeon]|nr:hypothetical protein [Candidatus Bathyarchaeota archaeon]